MGISIPLLAVMIAAILQQTPTQTTRPQTPPTSVPLSSIFRILCTTTNSQGTAFLHKSGKVITAAHVVAGCDAAGLQLRGPTGSFGVSAIARDVARDLALLSLATPVNVPAYRIAGKISMPTGSPVFALVFPGGYSGRQSLFVGGHFSGLDHLEFPRAGEYVQRLVINIAFSPGTSGGPLLFNNEVVGVVSSGMKPTTPRVAQLMRALEKQTAGDISITIEGQNGQKVVLSQSQAIAEVFHYFGRHIELGLGHAVMLPHIREF